GQVLNEWNSSKAQFMTKTSMIRRPKKARTQVGMHLQRGGDHGLGDPIALRISCDICFCRRKPLLGFSLCSSCLCGVNRIEYETLDALLKQRNIEIEQECPTPASDSLVSEYLRLVNR